MDITTSVANSTMVCSVTADPDSSEYWSFKGIKEAQGAAATFGARCGARFHE